MHSPRLIDQGLRAVTDTPDHSLHHDDASAVDPSGLQLNDKGRMDAFIENVLPRFPILLPAHIRSSYAQRIDHGNHNDVLFSLVLAIGDIVLCLENDTKLSDYSTDWQTVRLNHENSMSRLQIFLLATIFYRYRGLPMQAAAALFKAASICCSISTVDGDWHSLSVRWICIFLQWETPSGRANTPIPPGFLPWNLSLPNRDSFIENFTQDVWNRFHARYVGTMHHINLKHGGSLTNEWADMLTQMRNMKLDATLFDLSLQNFKSGFFIHDNYATREVSPWRIVTLIYSYICWIQKLHVLDRAYLFNDEMDYIRRLFSYKMVNSSSLKALLEVTERKVAQLPSEHLMHCQSLRSAMDLGEDTAQSSASQ